jgi:amino acid adenylation domain-containing protein
MTVRPGARTLVELFDQVAGESPDRPALIDEHGSALSYAEVGERSKAMAAELVDRGVQAGTLVGLVVQRTAAVPVTILALLRCGAAYVPLDPTYPLERLRHLVSDARLDTIVGDVDALPVQLTEPGSGHDAGQTPEGLAYVIYTSGSTGAPKGCMVSHENVLALLRGCLPLLDVGPNDRWTLFHSASFDVSVFELWAAWSTGAAAVVVPEEAAHSPRALLDLLLDQQVTILSMVPSVFRHLADEHADAAGPTTALRYVLFAGESVQLDVVASFVAASETPPAIINLYGITETTVHSTFKLLGPDDLADPSVSPIGRELPHVQIVLRGPEHQPVPDGEEGEIWVYGPSVALGYLHRPELNHERFVRDETGRGYRSGDMARRRADGELDYLGRRDQQVKLNGFRIELQEIEAALRSHVDVREVAIVVQSSRRRSRSLLAIYVPRDPACLPSTTNLEEHARSQLPEFMIPRRYEAVAALPLTASGKLDRATLASALAAREAVSGD